MWQKNFVNANFFAPKQPYRPYIFACIYGPWYAERFLELLSAPGRVGLGQWVVAGGDAGSQRCILLSERKGERWEGSHYADGERQMQAGVGSSRRRYRGKSFCKVLRPCRLTKRAKKWLTSGPTLPHSHITRGTRGRMLQRRHDRDESIFSLIEEYSILLLALLYVFLRIFRQNAVCVHFLRLLEEKDILKLMRGPIDRIAVMLYDVARLQGRDKLSRSGEIGRHATFRALCLNWHGGSSPPFGTPYFVR